MLRNYLLLPLMILVGAFLFVDAWWEFYGVPRFAHRAIMQKLVMDDGTVSVGWIKAGIFRGIILEQVYKTQKLDAETVVVSADEIHFSLDYLESICGNLLIDELAIHNLNSCLEIDEDTSLEGLAGLDLNGHLSGDGTLYANVSGSLHNVKFYIQTVITNGKNLGTLVAQLAELKNSAKIAGNPDWTKKYAEISKRIDLGNQDSHVTAHLTGDALDISTMRCNGAFSLSHAQIFDCYVNKLRGYFALTTEFFSLSDVQLIVSDNETIYGEAVCDFETKEFSSTFQGKLIPHTALRLLNIHDFTLPKAVELPMPMTFAGTAEGSTEFDKLPVISCRAHFNRLKLWNISIFDGTFNLDLQDDMLKIQDFTAATGPLTQEIWKMDFQWDLKKNLISGDTEATFNTCRLLQDLRLIPYTSTLFTDLNATSFKMHLAPSKPEYQALNASISISEDIWKTGFTTLKDLTLSISLQEGQPTTSQLAFNVSSKTHDVQLDFSAETNLLSLRRDRHCAIPFSHRIISDGQTLVEILGTAEFDADDKALSISRATADVKYDDAYRILESTVSLPEMCVQIMSALHNEGAPFHAEFSGTPIHWNDMTTGWSFSGTITAPDGGAFNGLAFKNSTGNFYICHDRLVFSDIRGSLVEGGDYSISDLDYRFFDETVEMRNIDVVGPPEAAVAFIIDEDNAELYKSIWEGVVWDRDSYPEIHADRFWYKNDIINYNLVSTPVITVKNGSYRNFTVPEVTATININLPTRLDIDPIQAKTGSNVIDGNVSLLFGTPSRCNFFASNQGDADFDVKNLITAIVPTWSDYIANWGLSKDNNFNIDGEFTFDNFIIDYLVSGNLNAGEITWGDYMLKNPELSWSAHRNGFNLNMKKADFLEGTIATTGSYDYNSSKGEIITSAKRVSAEAVHQLAKRVMPQQNEPMEGTDAEEEANEEHQPLQGYYDVISRFNIYRNWGGYPLYLEGNGHLHMYDADLWRIPVMTTLGKMISFGSFQFFSSDKIAALGIISELDANFEFLGSRVLVPTIQTNGTFISLNGHGEYDFNTNFMRFVISSQLMKNVNLLSILLRPINWTCDAELVGTPRDAKWKMRTFLRKIVWSD